jgi:hypothetical protein
MTDAANRPDPNLGWPPQEEMGGSINLLEYVNMLLRRRWLIIVGTLLTVVAAGVYLKLQTPLYQAAIRVLPSREQAMSSRIDQSFGLNRGAQQQGYEQADLATQYYQELINSFPFLEKIVRKKYRLSAASKEFDLIEYYKVKGVNETDKVNKAIVALRKVMSIMIPRSSAYGAVRTMAIGVVADNPVMAPGRGHSQRDSRRIDGLQPRRPGDEVERESGLYREPAQRNAGSVENRRGRVFPISEDEHQNRPETGSGA